MSRRDPKLPVVGEETLCAQCKSSRMVTVKTEPHPTQVHQLMQEYPTRELPPAIYHVESFCSNPVFTGKDVGVRLMGTVVECEEFRQR